MQTLHFQCCYLCNRHKFRELKDTQQEVCAGRRTFRFVFCVDIQYGGRVVFFNEAHSPWWTKFRKNVQFLPTVQRKFFQKVLVLNFEVLIIQQLVNIFYCAIIICSSLCFRPQCLA